jgi:hypothetical protein
MICWRGCKRLERDRLEGKDWDGAIILKRIWKKQISGNMDMIELA